MVAAGTTQVLLVTPSIIKPLVEVVTRGEEAEMCSTMLELLLVTFRKNEIPVAGVSKSKFTGIPEINGFLISSVSASLLVTRSPVSWVLAMIRWLPVAARFAVAVNVQVAVAFGAIGLVLYVSGVAVTCTPSTNKRTGTAGCGMPP